MKMCLIKVEADELASKISSFESMTGKQAYLIMSGSTMGCLETTLPSEIVHSKDINTGIVGEFIGRKVFIDKDINFGTVEIR